MSQFRRQPADIRIVTGGFIFQVAFGEMKSLWLALLVLFTPISGVIGIRLKSNEYIIIMKKVTIVIFAIVFYFMRQLYQKYMKN